MTNARKNTVLILLTLLLTLTALSSSACSEKERFPSTEEESAAVLKIGGFDVPYEIYRYFALNYRDQYENGTKINAGDEDADELAAYVEKYTEESLKSCYGTLSLAKDYGMSVDDKAVNDALDMNVDYYVNQYGGENGYIDTLGEGYLTDGAFRFTMAVQILRENLYYHMLENGIIPNDDELVNEKLRGDDFIRVKQILIATDEGESKLDSLDKANRALNRARNGEDFDALIVEYGEDMNMFMNTDGYYFTRGEMLEDFENAAFALDIGEISDIVETSVGYSIILRLEKEEAYIAENFETLREQYLAAEYNKLLNERIAELEITAVDGAVIPDIFSMETAETPTTDTAEAGTQP